MGNIPNYIQALNNYTAYENIRPRHISVHYRILVGALAATWNRLTREEKDQVGKPPPQILYYIRYGRIFNTRTQNMQDLWNAI
jgi:hypothetical protein